MLTPTAQIIAWTAANHRARDEYAAHPFAACRVLWCDDVTSIDGGYCTDHACTFCKRRKRDGAHRRCYTCRTGGRAAVAARMKRRRRRAGAA